MAEEYRSPISGLTNDEAKELHSGFMMMMTIYFIIAAVAHYLVWLWRPWFPGTPGYVKATEVITSTLSMFS